MSPQRRTGALVALLLAAAVGGTAALRARHRAPREGPAHVAPAPVRGVLPRDALAWVPAQTRLLVVADLDALRRAPATAPWFSMREGSCEAALARRVRTVALVVPSLRASDFAFVAAGDLSPQDLDRCAPGSEPVEREGHTLRVLQRRDGGAPRGSVVWTPAGVVLVGSAPLVESMLTRGFDAMHGDAAPLSIDPLRRHVHEGAALWALTGPAEEALPDDPLRAVLGAAASVRAGDGLSLDATLRCDDSAHAQPVADAVSRLRTQALATLTAAPLRRVLDGARIETDGPSVRVEATIDGNGVEALTTALRELAAAAAGR